MQQEKKVAMLFSDIKGYSKLSRQEIYILNNDIEHIQNELFLYSSALYTSIAGDGLVVVMDSVIELAEFALNLRDKFIKTNWIRKGFKENIQIRIALHFGKVTMSYDDNKNIKNIIGVNVITGARIEPIVKEDSVFCSESFFNRLNQYKEHNIKAISLGEVNLAKNYGKISLYELEWEHIYNLIKKNITTSKSNNNDKKNITIKKQFLDKLYIVNYKILDNFSISFQNKNDKTLKTVILAGINGSGKTSILEYISFNFENSIYFPIISDSLDDRENLINNPKKLVIDKIKAFIDKIKDENLDLTVREANQKAIDSINDTFKDIELSVKFNGISTDMERRLLFKNSKSDNIWLEELSTGEQQLFIRALSLKLLEAKEQIILIDEPETSLHPSWQQSILKVYENIAKEGSNQLIIATHSPHIISSARKESVKILVNIDGDIKVLEDISGSYGFEVSRVLTELMGLKSLRVPDISKKIEKLWNLIYEEKQDEYQKLYEELEAILGKDDKDIILSKLEIAKNKSRKC